jgi:uncharacterized protein (TIGR02217 family)
MAIVVFADVVLPPRVIAAGVRGKQLRKNSRVTVDSGAQAVNIVWEQTLREFEIGFKPMLRESWQAIEQLHEVTEGGAYGFLMEDPKDAVVDITQGVVAATAYANEYRLFKRYTVASRYKDRKITRPMAAGLVIKVDGVALSALSSPIDYTVDVSTGLITIASGPTASHVTWSGRFYVPVHFQADAIDWSMLRPGSDPDGRLLAGPSCVLEEIRE